MINTSDAVRQFFERDLFARHSGIELVSVAPGQAVAQMTVGPHHLNGVGTVHGGTLFTLADFAFAVACNSHGLIAVAINGNISFMKAVSSGILRAEARELSVNPRLGTYTVDIKDAQGDLVAVFQGLAYRKKEPLPG